MFDTMMLLSSTEVADAMLMPALPPSPLIESPRSTTLPPGALMMIPSPEITETPA